MGSLTAPLSKVVREGLAKPTQRVDGLAALLAAAYATAADSQVRTELERDKLWAVAVQPASALLAPVMLAKLPAEDAALAVRLAEELLLHVRALPPGHACHARSLSRGTRYPPTAHAVLQHVQHMDAAATAAVARLLLACLLHSSASVRRRAAEAAERCTSGAPDLRGALIGVLLEMLRDVPAIAVRCVSCSARLRCQPAGPPLDFACGQALVDPSASVEDGGVSPAAIAQRCLYALLAITPLAVEANVPLPAHLAALWLLAAHHPVLAEASGASRGPWSAVRRRGGSWAPALAQAPDAAISVLVGAEGIASGRPAEEKAAQAALGSAMVESAPELFEAVLAALQRLTDRREHDALSPNDIKIYQTPPGAPSVHAARPDLLCCRTRCKVPCKASPKCMLPAGEVALEVDINALGVPSVYENGGGANGLAAGKKAHTKKAALAGAAGHVAPSAPASSRGTTSSTRGRAAGEKPAERKDPAVEMRERQLAMEAVVRYILLLPAAALQTVMVSLLILSERAGARAGGEHPRQAGPRLACAGGHGNRQFALHRAAPGGLRGAGDAAAGLAAGGRGRGLHRGARPGGQPARRAGSPRACRGLLSEAG